MSQLSCHHVSVPGGSHGRIGFPPGRQQDLLRAETSALAFFLKQKKEAALGARFHLFYFAAQPYLRAGKNRLLRKKSRKLLCVFAVGIQSSICVLSQKNSALLKKGEDLFIPRTGGIGKIASAVSRDPKLLRRAFLFFQ